MILTDEHVTMVSSNTNSEKMLTVSSSWLSQKVYGGKLKYKRRVGRSCYDLYPCYMITVTQLLLTTEPLSCAEEAFDTFACCGKSYLVNLEFRVSCQTVAKSISAQTKTGTSFLHNFTAHC